MSIEDIKNEKASVRKLFHFLITNVTGLKDY